MPLGVRSRPAARRCPVLALVLTVLALSASACSSCRRTPELPPEVHREAVTAFYTALAAIETSQEVLAREKLDRLVAIAAHEPAGWANLGLLLLRQQEIAGARERLTRASDLTPDEATPAKAAIVRLQALTESRAGDLAASTRLWREALDLDPTDAKAAYALAQELERQGGAEKEAEAQRVLEGLLAKGENLPARLDYARLAAKRGDAAALTNALLPLEAGAAAWPPAARERLAAIRSTAAANPKAAATQVVFLRNVLVRDVAYRRALARLTTPLDAIGEPLTRLVVLANPAPAPAAPDAGITFTVSTEAAWPADLRWAGALSLDGEGTESVLAADALGILTGPAVRAGTLRARSTAVWPDAVAAADLNYDFRIDLAVASAGGITLLRQQDARTFTDVTAASGLPAEILRGDARGLWPADIDLEGDLDLVLAPTEGPALVLRNNGDGTFVSQQPFGPCRALRGFVWADFDGDGVPDAACLDASGSVQIFVNLRGGAFEAVRLPDARGALAAIASADVDGDGRAELLAVDAGGSLMALGLADPAPGATGSPGWRWRGLAAASGVNALSVDTARLLVADLDNNAALDLIVAGDREARVVLGGPDGRFEPLPAPVGLRASATADLDGDGRLEIVGLADGRLAVARSRGTKPYHWQRLRPRAATATGDQRVNSFGIGGEIEVRTGLHVQTQRISSPIVHFGLGEARAIEVARVIWPNGALQSEFDLKADATLATPQRLKGSCPWLFAWNGREMAFVTDLIWRSPLGLRINAQATADVLMTEDWVKVGGSQLAPRDGHYDLRITAELWETHFFDLVSLAVVDHPAGTEVFVDERFAVPPPSLAAIVTNPLQAFAAVVDDLGRDQREVVAARDDRHLDFAGRGAYQGVTRQHAVELTLPDVAPRGAPLWLVAQGWVHPTDSSINVALAQGRHAPPSGLVLEVADAAGRFRPVRTGLGFPSGKDKTVLIDLTGLFPATGSRRLRLSTNLEIYWDRLSWAEGRPDVTVAPRRVPLASAELRFRGYSPTTQTAPSSPERPRYVVEGTAPRWLDLEGFHTRFGDVRELLGGVDDRYVIMNAGDELALRFPEVAAPAPGLVRDFVVIGDGWVKDGDFNTSFSRTVLPLPTHAGGRYDRAPSTLEGDPIHRRHAADFATYHTRYVTPERARDALRARERR